MPIQAFIDESETSGQHFVFAGFIGPSEGWAEFAHRWEAVLRQQPEIERFKFRELDHCTGSFSRGRLSESARKRRVAELVAAMSGAGFRRISVTLGIPAFSEMSKSVLAGTDLAQPYCYAFQLMIAAVASELLEQGQTERFEILFDEQLMFGPNAKKWYPLIRELCVTAEVRSILPIEPIFRKDDDTCGLQAADLYAGLVRSGGGEKNAAMDAMLSPLLAALSSVPVTGAAGILVQAEVVWRAWDSVTSTTSSPESFGPIVARLRKSLAAIGGEPTAERKLAPIFAAVDAVKLDDPDGFNWLRQELAEVTVLSRHSQYLFGKTKQAGLDEAMRRHGITRDQLGSNKAGLVAETPTGMADVDLNRAIALLEEESIGAFRRKAAKRRARAAAKPQRRIEK